MKAGYVLGGLVAGSAAWNWDVSPDGQRFLINSIAEALDPTASAINVVLNWIDLVKR